VTLAGSVLATADMLDFNGIQLYDLSDPDDPVQGANIMEPAEGNLFFLSMSGCGDRLAFMVSGRGYAIWTYDVSDPDEPRPLRVIELLFAVVSIGDVFKAIDDDLYALIGDAPAGICHLAPEDEDEMALTRLYYPPEKADILAIRDGRLIMMSNSHTHAAWLDPPERPRFTHTGFHAATGFWYYNLDMAVGEDWAAVDEVSIEGISAFVRLFRWDDDQPIRCFNSLRHPPLRSPNLLNIDNRLALRLRNVWGIFDLDQGNDPVFMGETEQPLSSGGVSRDGWLFCTDGEIFRVFEIGELPEMELIAEVEAEGSRVFLNGDIAYLTGSSGIFIMDLSDPENPEPIGLFEVDYGVRQLAFSGQSAYATTADGLVILDISDPEEIVETGYYHPAQDVGDEPENSGFGGIAVNGDLIYTSGNSWSRSLKGLYILRVNEGGAMQEVFCREGWSIVSSYIDPSEPALEDIFANANLRDLLRLCKDADGRFYSPPFNFNNIGDWDVTQAYWVAMESDHTLSIRGEPVPPDTPVPLRAGWNAPAYFPRVEVEAEAAFADIENVLLLAKDDDGDFYVPEHEFNNMDPLRPGRGYQVKVSEEVELVWNVEEQRDRLASHSKKTTISHFVYHSRTGGNMSILIDSDDLLYGEVGVFTGDLCVGGTVITGSSPYGIAVWGDDNLTPEVDGASTGDELKLRWFDGEGCEVTLEVKPLEGELVYEFDGFTVLSIDPFDHYPVEFGLIKAYPNPFNDFIRFTFGLSKMSNVTITVYDVTGRLVASLVDDKLSAGYHDAVWEAGNVSAGLYLVRMEAVDYRNVEKVILLK